MNGIVNKNVDAIALLLTGLVFLVLGAPLFALIVTALVTLFSWLSRQDYVVTGLLLIFTLIATIETLVVIL